MRPNIEESLSLVECFLKEHHEKVTAALCTELYGKALKYLEELKIIESWYDSHKS